MRQSLKIICVIVAIIIALNLIALGVLFCWNILHHILS